MSDTGVDGRKADPSKIEQLRNWPEHQFADDIVSYVQLAQYLREFFGPAFPEKRRPPRRYDKKGVDFE